MTPDFGNAGRKLDSRLRALLRLPLEELRHLKREEGQGHRQRHLAIEALRAQALAATGDRLRELSIEIEKRVSRLPVPLTFGVYFPEDDAEDVARVTHLEEPFASVIIRSDASAQDLAAFGLHVRNQAGNLTRRMCRSASCRGFSVRQPSTMWSWRDPGGPSSFTPFRRPRLTPSRPRPPAVTGKGVIVGIVESGALDFYHPAFRKPGDTKGQGAIRVVPDPLSLGPDARSQTWVTERLVRPRKPACLPFQVSIPVGGPGGPGTYGTEYGQAQNRQGPRQTSRRPTPPSDRHRASAGSTAHW